MRIILLTIAVAMGTQSACSSGSAPTRKEGNSESISVAKARRAAENAANNKGFNGDTPPVIPSGAAGASDPALNIAPIVSINDQANLVTCPKLVGATYADSVIEFSGDFNSSTTDFTTESLVTTACELKGKVQLPTNHILNIEMLPEQRVFGTDAILGFADGVVVDFDVLQSISGEAFGNIYIARIDGARNGLQTNVLIAEIPEGDTIYNKMTCADAKKVDTEMDFDLTLHFSLSHLDTEIPEAYISTFGPFQFKVNLSACPP